MCMKHLNKAGFEDVKRVHEELGAKFKGRNCTGPECIRIATVKGMCLTHYTQIYDGRTLRVIQPRRDEEEECQAPRCKETATYTGLCGRHNQRSSKYGLTPDEAVVLWNQGTCDNPGCSNTSSLHIDHNHKTGEVRGLLCMSCNTSLGALEEDRNRISGLVEYLEKNLTTDIDMAWTEA